MPPPTLLKVTGYCDLLGLVSDTQDLTRFHSFPGTCADNPLQFDPPRIAVQFGSPASVNCTSNVTKHDGMGLEAPRLLMSMMDNVTFLTWTVESITEWDIMLICFINADEQYEKKLNVTVYSEFFKHHFFLYSYCSKY